MSPRRHLLRHHCRDAACGVLVAAYRGRGSSREGGGLEGLNCDVCPRVTQCPRGRDGRYVPLSGVTRPLVVFHFFHFVFVFFSSPPARRAQCGTMSDQTDRRQTVGWPATRRLAGCFPPRCDRVTALAPKKDADPYPTSRLGGHAVCASHQSGRCKLPCQNWMDPTWQQPYRATVKPARST